MIRPELSSIDSRISSAGRHFCGTHAELSERLKSDAWIARWKSTPGLARASEYSRGMLEACLSSFGSQNAPDAWRVASQIAVGIGTPDPQTLRAIHGIAELEGRFLEAIEDFIETGEEWASPPGLKTQEAIRLVSRWAAIRACRRVCFGESIFTTAALRLFDLLARVGAATPGVGRAHGSDKTSVLIVPSTVHSIGMALHLGTEHLGIHPFDMSKN